MSLFELDLPRPEENGPLRSLSAENADGNVLSFGEEIKLVTKFGRQSIEYNGRVQKVPKVAPCVSKAVPVVQL